VIEYRTFRNIDPPGITQVWNTALTGRGAVRLNGPAWLEYFIFSKPYFDPESLLVAADDARTVGFALSGFGTNETESGLDSTSGVVCLLAVTPDHRRQGIGSELLRRSEDYLRQRGAQVVLAGPMYPCNPYGFGIYGGSQAPGFLDSDALARPFLQKRGFVPENPCVVLHRSLQKTLNLADARFAAHRLRYEVHANPFHGTTWWQECLLGPIELHEYRLQDKLTGRTAARALMWEMETYQGRWNEHVVGLTELLVQPTLRRQGLGKFLLAQILRYLHDQFFSGVEVQTPTDNTAALNLLTGLGFEQVDSGSAYRRVPS
jgi:ribosomal protein S18 acetylase RimI-like enzyme